jgi:hypothetical protein
LYTTDSVTNLGLACNSPELATLRVGHRR